MKKRILHVLSSKEYSGAENVVISIIKEFESDYECAYASPRGPIVDVLKKEGIEYLPLNSNRINCLHSVFKYWKPDIIHAHDFRASVKTAFSPYKCIKISHLHQNPSWIKSINVRSILYSISCIRIDKIVFVSPEILEEAVFSSIIKNKSFVIANNIDVKSILNAANEICFVTKFDVAFVGRLTKVKDPLKFIRIVKKLTKENNEINAVMVGNGELKDACEKLIGDLDLYKNIKMMGFLDNPFPVINNSRILVITSEWEGFGLVAVEAMALGKPVLATPVGGLKSIVNSSCGKFCNSEEEFSKEIINLLENKEEYNNLSEGATKNAFKFADKENWINSIRDIYDNF